MSRAGAIFAALLAVVIAPPAASAQSGKPEGGACTAAAAGVALDSLRVEDGLLSASGTWKASDGASGALLEYRNDSDRYRAEVHSGPGGTWRTSFPFELCGRHAFRVLAIPLTAGENGETACLARIASAHQAFDVPCSAGVTLSDCEWECQEGESARCVGTCEGAVRDGGKESFVAQMRSGNPLFATVGDVSPGPWRFQVECKRGEPVDFRVREPKGRRRYSPPASVPCGG